ncbi:hypothetical protein J3458_002238 [Metarhizium acridum]|uniref:Uncharacterized protein n=1 Tax=Metarhizium acridum (strain CQMa 102) TaxID=655827 RepID=E9E5M7_METAQ|nr:uncharacterized protein MAC_05175 [Metarhizium acridum CQMa 102]EFY88740.1 hypothetical protein MAC_05175 [Metarhizium acridum CQMa 102]KAG8425549.1 hypothetical protein J3458_002238 [Metarhizium acridum]
MRRLDFASGCQNTQAETKDAGAAASTRIRPSKPSKPSRSSIASAPAGTPTPAPSTRNTATTTRRIVSAPSPSSPSPRQTPTPKPRVAATVSPTVAPRGVPTQPHLPLLSRHSARQMPRLPTPGLAANTTNSSTTPAPAVAAVIAATADASRASLRSSSQHHKQHVISLAVKTRSPPASLTKMPPGERPRQPQLSAAAARSINRTPLTPKIAAKRPPVTPLARRPHSSTPTLAGSQNPRDDVSTPVAAFLAHNITPRSGPRQNRVDSANSTPNGTPNPERTSDSLENNNNSSNNASRLGLGISPPANDLHRQAASQLDLPSDSNDSSKFFYASDARSIQQAGLQRPGSVSQKSANTFFYANGTTADGGRSISPPSNATSISLASPNPESAATKFFYANGTPDMPPRPGKLQSTSESIVSSNSRIATSRPPTSNPNAAFSVPPTQRPASPIKAASTPMTQTLRNNVASPPSPKRTSLVSSPPSLPQQTSSASRRRVSIDTAPKEMGGHRRTGSVPGFEPRTVPRFNLSPNPSETASVSPPLSPGFSQPAMTMASILQVADELQDDTESIEGDAQSDVPPPVPQSPTKSAHFGDSVSELVANARRERKVQDLEITNASLEAINRTLERQLRKQTAELRRYRRLSRSGALSAASSRVTSLALTEPPTDMSDVEEEDETELEEDMDSVDDSDLSSNETMSTEDIMLSSSKLDARRRRDERRLHLDLTKHQELLIDSQRMNQSLKRCLDFTEALIKEGQKALQYNVRVSDIQLGGRVLAPSDDYEDEVSYQEEDTIQSDGHGLEPPWPKAAQDRDSGIELPTDGG